jgi:hypothetical protein
MASKTGVKDVRPLRGVLEREKAAMGVLISVIAALVRLQDQRVMVSGNALSRRILAGTLGFSPDLDRFMEGDQEKVKPAAPRS